MRKTFEEANQVHRHQCLFPNLVEHLQVVVAQITVQQVVHAIWLSLVRR